MLSSACSFLKYFILLHMNECFTCMYVHNLHDCWISWNWGYRWLYGSWESNPGPQKEQQTLLTTKLQPQSSVLVRTIFHYNVCVKKIGEILPSPEKDKNLPFLFWFPRIVLKSFFFFCCQFMAGVSSRQMFYQVTSCPSPQSCLVVSVIIADWKSTCEQELGCQSVTKRCL